MTLIRGAVSRSPAREGSPVTSNVDDSNRESDSVDSVRTAGRAASGPTVADLFRDLDHDQGMRQAFRSDPTSVLRTHGFDIPEHVEARVVDGDHGRLHITLRVGSAADRDSDGEEGETERIARLILERMEKSASEMFGRPCPASRDPGHAHMHVSYGRPNVRVAVETTE